MSPRTSPIMIFPVLDYMGCSEVNLIGCDFNIMKNFPKAIEHFYEKDPRRNASDGKCWTTSIKELENTTMAMKQFQEYNKYYRSKGKIINNLSPGSWIDFLNTLDFCEVLK